MGVLRGCVSGESSHLSIAHFLSATRLFFNSSAKLFKEDKLLCSKSFNNFTSISSREAARGRRWVDQEGERSSSNNRRRMSSNSDGSSRTG